MTTRKALAALNYAHSVQAALAGNSYAFSMAARFRVAPLKGGVLATVTKR
jgi:hypothetical protein